MSSAIAVEGGKRGRAEPSRRGVKRELLGLMLVAAGLMICLALISYHPNDPSWNSAGSGRVRNWIGPLGATLADVAHQFLGLGAYLVAWVPAAFGLAVLLGQQLRFVTLKLLAFFSLTIVVSAMCDFVAGNKRGGWLGELIVNALSVRIGSAGAAIALGCAAIALAIATVNFSFARLALAVTNAVQSGASYGWVRGNEAWGAYIDAREARLKEEKKRAVEEAKEEKARKKAEAEKRKLEKAQAPEEEFEPEAFEDDDEDPIEVPVTPLAKKPDPPKIETPRIEAPKAEKKKPAIVAKAAVTAPERESDTSARTFGSPAQSPLDEEPDSMGDAHFRVKEDGPGEFGSWPDEPEVLAKPQEAEWKNDSEVAALAMRAAAGPLIVDLRSEEKVVEQTAKAHGSLQSNTPFELPDISLLDYDAPERVAIDSDKLLQNARKLERKLKDYGIDGAVVEIRPGPVVTMYEFLPAAGIKVSKIASLSDDLAMAMEALRVRIVAPIPGKGVVGIEIPSERRETVYLKEIVSAPEFSADPSKLTLAIGKDIEGKPYTMDLAKAPHLLIAGATGSGKSVAINTIVLSLLYRATPDEVRLLMVDPKMLELSVYQGIPHLLLPVVTDPKKAALALRWAVEEMERRYQLLSEAGVRNISGYNKKVEKIRADGPQLPFDGGEPKPLPEKLPYIVIIIDELADLMMVASREVETSIARLAQMARAAGLHLILATQRPSVDVLTGVIKANFPARISFQVASRHDSRTILDSIGAENLLGMGDMLILPPGTGGMQRSHGAYVSEVEIQRVTDFLKKQGTPQYDESILKPRADEDGEGGEEGGGEDEYADELYDQAVAIVADQRYASVSMIQRRMRIGYNRAARIIERMEKEGVVGPGDGAKPREVLIKQVEQ